MSKHFTLIISTNKISQLFNPVTSPNSYQGSYSQVIYNGETNKVSTKTRIVLIYP